MREITIPVLNANDVDYLLVEWYAQDGQAVTAGQPVAMIETSKATEDLEADASGILDQVLAAGSPCRPGSVIGRVHDNEADRSAFYGGTFTPLAGRDDEKTGLADGTGCDDDTGPLLTDAARSLVTELGVSPESLRTLGKRVVRSSDIRTLAGEESASAAMPSTSAVTTAPLQHEQSETLPLSAVQRAVAATVSASIAVPAAFTVVKVHLDEADAPHAELVIASVAAQRQSRPVFFGSLDGDTVRVAAGAHVAVTVDVGRGLYLPVLGDAETLGPSEIAAALLRFRVKARKNTFTASELQGSNIGVTLHTESDVVIAQPVIYPGHICALAVCAVQMEIAASPIMPQRVRPYFNLGLAYDHRVVNGRDAIMFLDAIKRRIEHTKLVGT